MKYMCPVCNQIGECGRCCTDKPIPMDDEAIVVENYKLKKIKEEFLSKYNENQQRILKGKWLKDELNEVIKSLQTLINTFEAHDVQTESCDRDGKMYCDCLELQIEESKRVINKYKLL